jgi:hypothetical protein
MIPKNWDGVPIERWVKFMSLQDEEASTPHEIIVLQRKKVMAITGCTEEEARALKLSELQKITRLLTKPMNKMLIKRFKLNGFTYEVITRFHKLPSGKVEQLAADARILSTAQVTSALNTKGDLNRIHQVIFNVCRPVKWRWFKYRPYEFEPHEIEDRIKDFKQLPMGIAYPIQFFFTNLSRAYSDYTLDFLTQKAKQVRSQLSEAVSQIDSDGT